jgi:phage gpG-like protein
MPVKLHIEIQPPGEAPIKRALVLYQRIQDLSPAFQQMLPTIQQYTEAYFTKEGAHEGNPHFPPLSPQYAKWKQKHYPNAPILTRTGRLRQSLSSQTPDSIAHISPLSLTFGTRTPYAIYHQLGTYKMPRRPPIRLSKPLTTKLLTILRNYLITQGETP